MRNIFIGFILIILDFSLNFGDVEIGLIPDFIGYIIMMKGLVEMDEESTRFMKVKPYVTGMAIYTGFLYLLDLLGVYISFGMFTYVLLLTSVCVSLYISYNIVIGVTDTEEKYHTSLNGTRLKSTWTLLAVFNIITEISLLIPLASIIFIIITFIIAILFLVAFSKSKNLYYDTISNQLLE